MDEMAAQLNAFAGGMQQSFATVFDRVGQSLEQSAQMMQMMNDVMEAALLQNLQATCAFSAPESALRLQLANASQIHVAALDVAVRLDGQDTGLFSTQIEALAPGDERELLVSVDKRGDRWASLAGTIRLSLQSPGTQEPLAKSVPFHVFFFESCVFEPVGRDAVDLGQLEAVESTDVTLEALRHALRLSPLDAMMTTEQGCYRVTTSHSDTAFYMFVRPDAALSPPFRVGVASSDAALQAQCERMLRDLELFSSQME